MFKIYQKYIISNFILKFLNISIIFFCLTIILGLLEEISFFKNLNVSALYPYFLTILNAPITLFEIFPFIFLLTAQFLFYDFFKKEELNLLKKNGLSNLKIIKLLFLISLSMGIFTVLIYYNLASKLKFHYTSIKNDFSNDNKYLAMVTDSGLWIKDEINDSILIIKSQYIEDNYLIKNMINEFNSNFELKRTIQSNKIDIENNTWILNDAIVFNPRNGVLEKNNFREYKINSIYDFEKINSLFKNFDTMSFLDLALNYKNLLNNGYSKPFLNQSLHSMLSMPFFLFLMTGLASILTMNTLKRSDNTRYIIIGLLVSVVIFYFKDLSLALGQTNRIPLILSVWAPVIALSLFTSIGVIQINEK